MFKNEEKKTVWKEDALLKKNRILDKKPKLQNKKEEKFGSL